MSKMTYQDVRKVMDTIEKNGMQAHYVLGAYEAMMADLIANLPKHKQNEAIRSFESLAQRVKSIEA
jgi:beta-mannanase